ncbi:DUF4260 domain-containing protein [Halobacillus ihumii]|uniref:DUF4260 domain-containing protein n=1 Tax=Halobacillus ihumii TaxID=2686092 RepID=UPI0013D05C40|nr:DUF4260 domain-containing protein [Halobacillus ihumii]
MNKRLLHIEGLIMLVTSIYFYAQTGYSWWMFVLLLLSPDLSALGYLYNHKLGAYLYNSFHTYTPPLLLILIANTFQPKSIMLSLGLIWIAHIAMDRMFGYGLKEPTNSKTTHLQKIS